MPSRRKRKRERRLAASESRLQAGQRGDREATCQGGKGDPAGLWTDASRSDLVLLRHAIREGWPVPEERRRPILDEVFPLLHSQNPRVAIGVTRVFLDADRANLRTETYVLRTAQG
jgi:hypothetical protein